ATAGVASGGDADSGGGQPFPARALHGGIQPALCGAGRGERDSVCAGASAGPGSGLLPPARARGESRQHRAARSAGVADREDALARNAGGVPRDPVRALGWTTDHSLRSAPGGSFFSRGVACAEAKRAIQNQTGDNLRGGRRFSALTSVALRAPSVSAEGKAKPDRSCAIKTGHFNVLPTFGAALPHRSAAVWAWRNRRPTVRRSCAALSTASLRPHSNLRPENPGLRSPLTETP